MSTLLLAYHFRQPRYTPSALERRLGNVARFYGLDRYEGVQHFRHVTPTTGLAFWHQRFSNVSLPLCQQRDGLAIATLHLPYGLTKLLTLGADDVAHCLPFLHDRLWDEPALLEEMQPPLALVSMDTETDTLRIMNDDLALTRLYEFGCADGTVWSNRIPAALIFGEEVPPISPQAFSTYAASGWYLDQYTPFERVEVLRPGSRIQVDGRADVRRSGRQDVRRSWLDKRAGDDPNRGFERLVRELRLFGELTPFSVGLSGGMDSRVICSFLFRHLTPEDVSAYTFSPPELEAQIAKQLMERLARPFPWEHRSRVRKIARNSILERAASWIRLYDGMSLPDFIYMNAPYANWFDQGSQLHVHIGGEAAEIANSYGYDQRHVGNVPWREHLRVHPLTSFAWAAPMLREDHLPRLQAIVQGCVHEAHSYGLRDYEFFDYWLLVARFGQAQVGGCSCAHVYPFAGPEWIRCSFAQSYEQKFDARLHRETIAHNQPRWADVPFFEELQRKVEPELVRGLGQRIFVWDSPDADLFQELLRDRAALDDVYDVDEAWRYFEAVQDAPYGVQEKANNYACRMILKHALLARRRELLDFLAEHATKSSVTQIASDAVDVDRLEFRPVAFVAPASEYKSRWCMRLRDLRVTPVDDGRGLRCAAVGSKEDMRGQYAGVRFPAQEPAALRIVVSFLNPQHVRAVYVDGYDANQRPLGRWQWNVHSRRPPAERAEYVLVPGYNSGVFDVVDEHRFDRVVEFHFFIRLTPGSETGFVLHRVETGSERPDGEGDHPAA